MRFDRLLLPEDYMCESTSTFNVPIRINDLGGWTEIKAAGHGCVCSLSVYSRYFGKRSQFRGIAVSFCQERVTNNDDSMIIITATDPDFDTNISPLNIINGEFDKRSLIQSTLAVLPQDRFVGYKTKFHIASPIPPGASTGTSSSVSVALIMAYLWHYDFKLTRDRNYIANLAIKVETEIMSRNCGIQDQYAAAFGLGANFITMDEFPYAKHSRIELSKNTITQLNEGLVTVFIGSHDSSETHKLVIDRLKNTDNLTKLESLRECARNGGLCLTCGNIIGYAELMNLNTLAQNDLHSDLVGKKFRELIDFSNSLDHKPLGSKPNGAAGEGGTWTALFENKSKATEFVNQAKPVFPSYYKYFEHTLVI